MGKKPKFSKDFKLSVVEEYVSGKYSLSDLSTKYNIVTSIINRWINKWYNSIEIKDYDPK
ncbi:transposase [Schnuerera ultunensis]|uniref:transposase n=1 Tax=Schnuerera ultunensis TaxID=45497 RepID=UPI00040344EC|nr:transposase [Schnuerera ultunensis]